MKQRWLIKPLTKNESTLTLQLDATTHDQLVRHMAAAIESMHCHQDHSLQQTKETSNEPTTTPS